MKCLNFLNADLIAQGLSPLDSRAAALKAGRLLLSEFRRFVSRRESFALGSTLSGTTYVELLNQARRRGFHIFLHYLWLPNPNVAIARVHERVLKGGHDVPVADIRRRFGRSLNHFSNAYAPLADRWAVWDSRPIPPKLLVESGSCDLGQLKAIAAMKRRNGHHKQDDFILKAQRAFRRVARQVRKENARLGLPLVLGEKNRVRLVRAAGSARSI